MSRKSKIKLHSKGFHELLTSDEAKRDVLGRAQKVATAAGDGFEAHQSPSKNRARAVVVTVSHKARRKQSKDNVLQRALNSGR